MTKKQILLPLFMALALITLTQACLLTRDQAVLTMGRLLQNYPDLMNNQQGFGRPGYGGMNGQYGQQGLGGQYGQQPYGQGYGQNGQMPLNNGGYGLNG